jgi:putative heme-binding domain-containing protein
LDALSDPDPALREQARLCIEDTREGNALQKIEERHRKKPFTGVVLAELRRAYHRDQEALDGPLFEGAAKPSSVEEYAKFAAANPGDPAHGREIFEETVRCNVCHALYGKGGQIGPDLGGVGAKYARSTLIESVLYPSKQILDGYRSTLLTMKNGDVLMGFVRDEKPAELVLLDAAAQRHPLHKDQIAKREESNISLMPEGLQTAMTLTDFADLIGFLESLKEPRDNP